MDHGAIYFQLLMQPEVIENLCDNRCIFSAVCASLLPDIFAGNFTGVLQRVKKKQQNLRSIGLGSDSSRCLDKAGQKSYPWGTPFIRILPLDYPELLKRAGQQQRQIIPGRSYPRLSRRQWSSLEGKMYCLQRIPLGQLCASLNNERSGDRILGTPDSTAYTLCSIVVSLLAVH